MCKWNFLITNTCVPGYRRYQKRKYCDERIRGTLGYLKIFSRISYTYPLRYTSCKESSLLLQAVHSIGDRSSNRARSRRSLSLRNFNQPFPLPRLRKICTCLASRSCARRARFRFRFQTLRDSEAPEYDRGCDGGRYHLVGLLGAHRRRSMME